MAFGFGRTGPGWSNEPHWMPPHRMGRGRSGSGGNYMDQYNDIIDRMMNGLPALGTDIYSARTTPGYDEPNARAEVDPFTGGDQAGAFAGPVAANAPAPPSGKYQGPAGWANQGNPGTLPEL